MAFSQNISRVKLDMRNLQQLFIIYNVLSNETINFFMPVDKSMRHYRSE